MSFYDPYYQTDKEVRQSELENALSKIEQHRDALLALSEDALGLLESNHPRDAATILNQLADKSRETAEFVTDTRLDLPL